MLFIVGLGNPGKKYRFSPHNMGYMTVDILAHTHKIRLKASRKERAEIGEGNIKENPVILFKPTSFVNLSGEAVRDFLKFKQ